jgi:hypothetical protein
MLAAGQHQLRGCHRKTFLTHMDEFGEGDQESRPIGGRAAGRPSRREGVRLVPLGSETINAAQILAEWGDSRDPYDGPDALAAFGGPVTRSSGKYRGANFRWACN